MLSEFASNVILSKARAMYGKRLTKQNYEDLLACRSVSDVTVYLKNNTQYGKILSGIEESKIHRGQLETKLRQKLLENYASLCHYEITVGEHFAQYFIKRNEIEQILSAILLLDAGMPEEYLFSMPAYLIRHTKINLKSLSKIKNFDDLLRALGHTEYRRLLEPFQPGENGWINYTGIESALYSYLYSHMFQIIQKYTHSETNSQLNHILKSFIDLTNFTRIVRLKISYHAEPEFIKKALFPYGSFSERLLDKMIAADSEEEITAILETTAIGKRALKFEHDYVGEIPRRMNFRNCHHYIDFSTHPSVVLISYIFTSEAEISDIITIVEGIRYQLPADEIRKLLIIVNN
ncbi:MAG: V-type ATPase subunit [Oscillospiraceae bacterium]|jgi:V/A-type H+-transporting ATPase subunit C|nr:V-type ATPase subunit [Oscillospiraceae bacterium]